MTRQSRRVGVIGVKQGMMQFYDNWGAQHPVTVVDIGGCQVTQVKPQMNNQGQIGLQVGYGVPKLKRVSKSLLGHFLQAGVPPKRKLFEFRVSPDAVLPPGWTISPRHFVPGQFLDVKGKSVGHGFQGVMKRWGFKGLPASHGVSLAHRSMGSTGQKGMGKVWKGKKMPGRMGGKNVCLEHRRLLKIDVGRSLLFILGNLPGKPGTCYRITDAFRERPFPFPFPTYIPIDGDEKDLNEFGELVFEFPHNPFIIE